MLPFVCGNLFILSRKKEMERWCLYLCFSLLFLSACSRGVSSDKVGVVVSVEDLETLDWARLAAENGINTIGTHVNPGDVLPFIQSAKGKKFLSDCASLGIQVEHQLHAMSYLLPRELYAEDSTLFRMNEYGHRVADFNCCATSEKALDIIAHKAAEYARLMPSTNHRYYFWLDDGAPMCQCPDCSGYTDSEKALLIENRIVEELRKVDEKAQLAHLAYHNTMVAPRKVKPTDGIFLEFAPFFRSWDAPITDVAAKGRTGQVNSDIYGQLLENLEVFPVETAEILEYWMDVSLYSNWKKPAVKLPWKQDIFEKDVEAYAKLGIRNMTTFAVYIDSAYVADYRDLSFLRQYSTTLKHIEKRIGE